MPQLLSSLLFATSVTAQITTSAWMPGGLGTDKLGFYGSVISANASHTALALSFDNQTTPDLDFLAYNSNWTITVGPTVYETVQTPLSTRGNFTQTDAGDHRIRCVRTTSTADATCLGSLGAYLASNQLCNTRQRTQPARTLAFTFTLPYSARATYSAGIQTLMQTVRVTPDTTRIVPDWCTGQIPANFSGSSNTFTVASSSIFVNQIIITAGLEKLNITSSSHSGSHATTGPPATTGGAGAGVTTSTGTGAAVPMRTMGPAAALGLGAAMAVFL